MIASDKLYKDTADARNDLETYVYDTRDKLYESLAPYIEESQRSELSARLDNMENWLYDDEGENSTKSVYKAKLKELRIPGDAAETRRNEAEKRPEKIQALKAAIVKYQMFAQSDDERYAHISAEDKDAVRIESTAIDAWLQDKLREQDSVKSWENPSLTCRDITSKLVAMSKVCQPIMDKPKPKPKPAPKKEEAKTTSDKKDDAGDKTTTEKPAAPGPTPTETPKDAPTGDKMDVDTEAES